MCTDVDRIIELESALEAETKLRKQLEEDLREEREKTDSIIKSIQLVAPVIVSRGEEDRVFTYYAFTPDKQRYVLFETSIASHVLLAHAVRTILERVQLMYWKDLLGEAAKNFAGLNIPVQSELANFVHSDHRFELCSKPAWEICYATNQRTDGLVGHGMSLKRLDEPYYTLKNVNGEVQG
jgi:hypothetical protein